MSDEDYRRGYRDGWKDRGSEVVPKVPPSTTPYYPMYPNYPTSPLFEHPRCAQCGLYFSGPMGYVCMNSNCPHKVTCTTKISTTSGTTTGVLPSSSGGALTNNNE